MHSIQLISPGEIEAKSFAIIREELSQELDPDLAPIIMRCIHSSADFEYVKTLYFSEGVLRQADKCLRENPVIVTDTNMAKAGINRQALSKLGGRAECFVADPDVAETAKKLGCTRSQAAVDKAARLEGNLIFVIGNAPTALIRLVELYKSKSLRPSLVIGVPVGFVNVVEAKEMLMDCDLPMIVNRGRKGGSNIAAAIVNALMYKITRAD